MHHMVAKRGMLTLNIHVPAGARGIYIEAFSAKPEELELLLDHDTELRILAITDRPDGRTHIDVDVIP